MNKYIYAVSSADYYPQIESIYGTSFTDAEERIINKYIEKFDITREFVDFEDFRDWMNEHYNIDFSDIEDIEEL